jgi:acyl-coenzyme A thioesterase PaaI-like protein
VVDDEVAAARRDWRAGVSVLVSYRYLGTSSQALGRHAAEGRMRIRPDLRGPVGVLAAPLGIALLDTAGINVDPLARVAPTRIDVDLFEPAADVEEVHVDGRVVREGRSQLFTEGRLTDARDRRRVLGVGSTHWAVLGANPGFEYVDHRTSAPPGPDPPPLHEVFGAVSRADGELEIPALRPELGGSALHQGPLQVVPEAAALLAAQRAAGVDLWIEHQGTSIVARASEPPLVTHSEVLSDRLGAVTVRVELRAAGRGDRVCAVTLCRFRRGDGRR